MRNPTMTFKDMTPTPEEEATFNGTKRWIGRWSGQWVRGDKDYSDDRYMAGECRGGYYICIFNVSQSQEAWARKECQHFSNKVRDVVPSDTPQFACSVFLSLERYMAKTRAIATLIREGSPLPPHPLRSCGGPSEDFTSIPTATDAPIGCDVTYWPPREVAEAYERSWKGVANV